MSARSVCRYPAVGGPSSQSRPSHRMASRMRSMYSSVERDRSVSSIRRMKTPPWWRANNQLNRAVRAPPTWRWPVGLGAKRTRTGSGITSYSTPYSERLDRSARGVVSPPRVRAAAGAGHPPHPKLQMGFGGHPAPAAARTRGSVVACAAPAERPSPKHGWPSRWCSEFEAAHDRAGEEADEQHHPAPDAWRVDHGAAGGDGVEDGPRDRLGLTGEGGHGQAGGHLRLDEARPRADDSHPALHVGLAESVEERREPGLRGAVEVAAPPRAISRDRAEGADGAAPSRRQARGRHLAEHHGPGEVHVEQPLQPEGIGGQLLLTGEEPAGHHQRIEPAEDFIRAVQGVGEARRDRQIQPGLPHRNGGPTSFEVARGGGQLGRVPTQKEDRGAAFGQQPPERAAHAARRADQDRLHAGSPRRRTDWAERKRRWGSHRSRTAFHSASRGIMRAKSSALVTASLAR